MHLTDTALQSWLQENLFEAVPSNIAIIDRNFRIVEHNQNFQGLFGSGRGELCYQVYKKRGQPCEQCIAARCFQDGKTRVNDEVGLDRNGRAAHYLVHMVPIVQENGAIPYIIEMSTDITEIKRLQREYQVLFEKVPCYIVVLNRDFRIVRANEEMQRTFGATTGQHCWEVFKRRVAKCENCPAERSFLDGETHTCQQVGINRNQEETYYVVTTSPLSRGGPVNHVIEMAVDVSRVHQLEQEKLEAERLAAVGQTVAGLAHGIKNILTGLEGGIYIFKTGMQRGDHARMDQGWGLLDRNIERISTLTKNLLSFSKGQTLEVRMVDPAALVEDAMALYRDGAAQHSILLRAETPDDVAPAPLDPEGIHTCLENLVSNALDACQMSERPGCQVIVRCRDENDRLVFEVEDNGCGIDYDIKQKIFTNFFTTKGNRGSGLGLLLTRKIAQEHGGKVVLRTVPGESTLFRLEFPRHRLPRPTAASEAGGDDPSRAGDDDSRPAP